MSENKYIEFQKNDKGEYIEGFLSDKEHFNGILFLLREPNTNRKIQKEFYFRKCLYKEENNSTMDFYADYFRNILACLPEDKKLEDCAYANIIPDHGMPSKSEEYKNLSNEERVARFKSLLNKKTKIIFVCQEEFDSIRKERNIEWEENCGIKYSNKPTSKRILNYNDNITVYEIYHPNYIKRMKLTIEPNKNIK